MIIEVPYLLGLQSELRHRVSSNGAPEPGASPLSVDLWAMRRMAPVPRIPSGPTTSDLARADRPSRRTSSSLPNRFPQRPYYRFYYAAVTSDVSASSGHVG
jgi:hypothetical protein